MPDLFTSDKRHQIMSRVKTKNTTPEVKLRSILHCHGFRFRLNHKELPGKPDVVLPKYKAVIFVHGCFWHGHNCNRGRRPQSNVDFWNEKIDRNIERDNLNIVKLMELGWRVLVVWGCEIKDQANLVLRLKKFLLESDSSIE